MQAASRSLYHGGRSRWGPLREETAPMLLAECAKAHARSSFAPGKSGGFPGPETYRSRIGASLRSRMLRLIPAPYRSSSLMLRYVITLSLRKISSEQAASCPYP